MLIKIVSLVIIFVSYTFATTLESKYIIDTTDFKASAIDKEIETDFLIYKFERNKQKKSFSSARLIKIFKKYDIKLQDKSRGLVHVELKSSLDFSKIKQDIRKYYQDIYPSMIIESVSIHSASFMMELPQGYKLKFKTNAYKYNISSLKINLPNSKKRYFINYEIKAKIKLSKASHNINRGKILNQIDANYKLYNFEKLRGIPLKTPYNGKMRLKKRIQEGNIIYEHNVETIPDVLKGKKVLVILRDGSVSLEFQAMSLEDAHAGDKIYVEKSNGKRLRVKVIGRNKVEIE